MYTKTDWIHSTIHLQKANVPKILCLHGFVGSAFDLKPLADSLAEEYDILIPKIPLPIKDGNNTLEAVQNLFYEYQPSIIVGFSMGGALTMLLPSCPKIIIAPYRGLPLCNELATKAASLMSPFILKIPKYQSGRIRSKEGRNRYTPGQWSFPTPSFLALQKLVDLSCTPDDSHPLLWIHSPSDPVASYKKAKKQWGKYAKHLCIEDAEHVLLYEDAYEFIINECQTFCATIRHSS